MREVSLTEMEDMQYSEGYAAYIMKHGNNSDRTICDGDTLTLAMEDGYLFEEYMASLGLTLP